MVGDMAYWIDNLSVIAKSNKLQNKKEQPLTDEPQQDSSNKGTTQIQQTINPNKQEVNSTKQERKALPEKKDNKSISGREKLKLYPQEQKLEFQIRVHVI